MKLTAAALAVSAVLVLASDALPQSAEKRFDSTGFMTRLNRELADFDQAKAGDVAARRSASPVRDESVKITRVLARISIYLLIVVAAIFGLAWLMRKGGMAGGSKLGGGNMDTLEVLPFGPNRSLVLARVVDAVYVLAQTQNSITVLEKIEGQRALDIVASSKGVVSITKFKDAFSHFMGKMKKS